MKLFLDAYFPLPLVGVPGVPTPTFDLPNRSYPAPPGIRQGFRKNPDLAAHNLAVPEFTIKEILTQTLYAPHFDKQREVAGPCSREVLIGPIFEEFRRLQNAQNPYQVDAPQVAQADALKPSLIAVWAGNNDSIATLFFPNRIEGRLTDPDTFDSRLKAVLKKVRGPGRGILLFDLPDLTRTPFMKPLGEEIKPLGFTIDVSRLEIPALFQGIVNQKIAEMKLPRFVASKLNRSPTREEFARGSAVPLTILGEHLEGLFRLAFDKGRFGLDLSDLAYFTKDEVLDAEEASVVRTRIAAYNTRIGAAAAADDVLLIPVFSTFQGFSPADLAAQGGLFSLDGIHPNAAGHRRVTGKVIEELNRKLLQRDFGGMRRGTQVPALE